MNDELLNRDQLQSDIHAALRDWHAPEAKDRALLAHLLLVQQRRAESSAADTFVGLRLVTNQILDHALTALEVRHEESAKLLRWRFCDGQSQQRVANRLHISTDTLSRRQRTALGALTDIIFEDELAQRRAAINRLLVNLPPSTYRLLVGLDDAQKTLNEQLLAADGPPVTAVVGLGGIGKTALADAVTRHLVQHFTFEKVVWLRHEPETMSGFHHTADDAHNWLITSLAEAISPDVVPYAPDARRRLVHEALNGRRHFIVIDNLEDEGETALLMSLIHPLAGTSRFLLTTRTRPAVAPQAYTYEVRELSRQDAHTLLREYGRELGINDIELLSEEDFDAIYSCVGGNPQALKLVISSLDPQPLPYILAGLSGGRDGDIAAMYRDIYEQTWRALSDPARELLETMTLVGGQGADPDHLQAASQLESGPFWQAVQELRNRSLIEVMGTPQVRRYGIHRLTELFLANKVGIFEAEEE